MKMKNIEEHDDLKWENEEVSKLITPKYICMTLNSFDMCCINKYGVKN